jgi:hypothetical protein
LQMRRKRLKKTENLFLWMCLRILIGNHQRVCITKLLISLYPNSHAVYLLFTDDKHNICNMYEYYTCSIEQCFCLRTPTPSTDDNSWILYLDNWPNPPCRVCHAWSWD